MVNCLCVSMCAVPDRGCHNKVLFALCAMAKQDCTCVYIVLVLFQLLSVEDVERIMDETAESVQYQQVNTMYTCTNTLVHMHQELSTHAPTGWYACTNRVAHMYQQFSRRLDVLICNNSCTSRLLHVLCIILNT